LPPPEDKAATVDEINKIVNDYSKSEIDKKITDINITTFCIFASNSDNL